MVQGVVRSMKAGDKVGGSRVESSATRHRVGHVEALEGRESLGGGIEVWGTRH